MEFLWMIIIGAIVGALAKLIMPGKDPGGIIVTIILGILGGIVGGFLFSLIGLGGDGGIINFVGAVLGAILLLWIYRLATSRRADVP